MSGGGSSGVKRSTPYPDASETSVITHPAPPTYQGIPMTPLIGDLLAAKQRHGKGGVVGTGGKAAVAIRFDDWQSSMAPVRRIEGTWTHVSGSRWKIENYPYAATQVWHNGLAPLASPTNTNAMKAAAEAEAANVDSRGEWHYASGTLHISALDFIDTATTPWASIGGNLYTLTLNTTTYPLLYTLCLNNSSLGAPQANLAAVNANNEWFYDTSTGVLTYYHSTNNPNTGGYYWFVGINPNDHFWWADSADVMSLMRSRGFPFSLVTVADGPDSANFSNNWDDDDHAPLVWWDGGGSPATDAQIMARKCSWRYWVDTGGEVWCHSKDHRDPWTGLGTSGGSESQRREKLSEWIQTAKANLETRASKTVGDNAEAPGIFVQGFTLPGTTPAGDWTPYGPDGLVTPIPGYTGEAGRLIMGNYPQSEAYAGHGPFVNAGSPAHGRNQATLSDIGTVDSVIANIDKAIAYGGGLELMAHCGNLVGVNGFDFDGTADDNTHLTLAEFTTVLDYIQSKRRQGLLEVVAPSSLPYIDPSSTNRVSLLEKVRGVSCGHWGAFADATAVDAFYDGTLSSKTITATGGPDGGAFLTIAAADNTLLLYTVRNLQGRSLDGMTFTLSAWVRSNHAVTAATPRFVIKDTAEGGSGWANGDRLNIDTSIIGLMTSAAPIGTWTQVYLTFTVPLGCNSIQIQFGHSGTSYGLDLGEIEINIV